eukprot:1498854-Rhodomonas_salina.1
MVLEFVDGRIVGLLLRDEAGNPRLVNFVVCYCQLHFTPPTPALPPTPELPPPELLPPELLPSSTGGPPYPGMGTRVPGGTQVRPVPAGYRVPVEPWPMALPKGTPGTRVPIPGHPGRNSYPGTPVGIPAVELFRRGILVEDK